MSTGRSARTVDDWVEDIANLPTTAMRRKMLEYVPASQRAAVRHGLATYYARIAREGMGPAAFDKAPDGDIEKRAMQLAGGSL